MLPVSHRSLHRPLAALQHGPDAIAVKASFNLCAGLAGPELHAPQECARVKSG